MVEVDEDVDAVELADDGCVAEVDELGVELAA
jgi:hypothetical protein